MIIVKIHGGPGNQMFQYALGRNLSLMHNVPFKIDSSYLRSVNQSGRVLQLDQLDTVLEEATSAEIQKYAGTFQKALDRLRLGSKKKKVVENVNVFDPTILTKTDGYFEGHWNNEKYFEKNWQTIQKDFTLKNPSDKFIEISQHIKSMPNAVSIHVRRGDYVSIEKVANIYTTLPASYYEDAIKKVLQKHPDAHFFIKNEDNAWEKENFPKNYPVTFLPSDELSGYEEMVLMSLCKHNIIANSTFSWWGAYLNQNLEKIVIAPKKWFVDQNQNKNYLIPHTWLEM